MSTRLPRPSLSDKVHFWPYDAYDRCFERATGFSSCRRKVLRPMLTQSVDEVTCPECIEQLARESIARLAPPKRRTVCPGCGYSDGVDLVSGTCHRCGEVLAEPA